MPESLFEVELGEFWRLLMGSPPPLGCGLWVWGLWVRDWAPLFLLPGLSCLCLKARSALNTFQNSPGLCKMPRCRGRAQAGPQGQELGAQWGARSSRGAHGDGWGWVPLLANGHPLSAGDRQGPAPSWVGGQQHPPLQQGVRAGGEGGGHPAAPPPVVRAGPAHLLSPQPRPCVG